MATQAPKNEVAVIPTAQQQSFEVMQREARLFSASPLIPQHLRSGGPEQALANCYIALKMARTMGEDPLVVLQNIHVVNGKAGFATQYMIARANSAGIFKGRIGWRVDRSDKNNLSVTAYAVLADTGEEIEFTADMAMAQAEKWTKNAKYKTMPEVMLRYRSAAFLIRFYAPDVMLGYHTSDEIEDVAAAAGPVVEHKPLSADMLTSQAADDPAEDAEVEQVEGEVVEPEVPIEQEKPKRASDTEVARIRRLIASAVTGPDLDAANDMLNQHRDDIDADTLADLDASIADKRDEVK